MWNNDQTVYSIRATIVKHDKKAPLTAEMLKEMLLQNGYVFPCTLYYVEFKDGTGAVCLYLDLKNDAVTPAILRQKVTTFCDMIKTAVLARDKAEKAATEAKAKAQAKADPTEPSVP